MTYTYQLPRGARIRINNHQIVVFLGMEGTWGRCKTTIRGQHSLTHLRALAQLNQIGSNHYVLVQ